MLAHTIKDIEVLIELQKVGSQNLGSILAKGIFKLFFKLLFFLA